MGKQDRFMDEVKRDPVAQVVDRGYPVREVAERLGDQHQVDLHVAAAVFAPYEGDPGGRCTSR